jgi:hypothetical protein
VPEQNAWAQIRANTQNLQLRDLTTLKFDSNASDPGVVNMKVTTEDGDSVVFTPSTQPGGEQGLDSWATHDMQHGTVRFNDDAGNGPDISWSQMLVLADEDDPVKTVRVTAGCSLPVGNDGAKVQVDNLTINDQVIDFRNKAAIEPV